MTCVGDVFMRGTRNIAIGGLVCLAGILVTAATYSAASGGGRYVVAWGAILFGGIQFLVGLVKIATGGESS
jgi:hypothetical protein